MTGFMALIAFILPIFIGMLSVRIDDKRLNFLISFVICAIVGCIFNFLNVNGDYSGMSMIAIANSLSDSVFVMLGMVKLSYEVVWDNKSVGKYVPNKIAHENQSILSGLDLKTKE